MRTYGIKVSTETPNCALARVRHEVSVISGWCDLHVEVSPSADGFIASINAAANDYKKAEEIVDILYGITQDLIEHQPAPEFRKIRVARWEPTFHQIMQQGS